MFAMKYATVHKGTMVCNAACVQGVIN